MARKRGRGFLLLLLAALLFLNASGLGAAEAVAATDYSKYSGERKMWGVVRNANHEAPSATDTQKFLQKYDGWYIGPHSQTDKVLYLTFDCGYENGYTPKILDVLKKKGVKATFFVTMDYIRTAPDIVKRMKAEGHIVGNHTWSHPDMTTLSVKEVKSELNKTAKYMKEQTGYTMDKVMRPPYMYYSNRTLKIMQDMGYATVLSSLAYMDWDPDDQPGTQYVIDMWNKNHHNGMIALMHAVSESNTNALATVIDNMWALGYRFGVLREELRVGSTSLKMYVGADYQIKILSAYPSGVTFASSDKSVATVDKNGKVKALKAGKAEITVKNATLEKKVIVTVMAKK